jgi:hypothetical protein
MKQRIKRLTGSPGRFQMVNTIICSFLIAWLGFFCGVLAENLRQEAKRARAKKKLIEIIDGMLDECQMIKQPIKEISKGKVKVSKNYKWVGRGVK